MIHSTRIPGNFSPKLNGSVRSNQKSFIKTKCGPLFLVRQLSDRKMTVPFNHSDSFLFPAHHGSVHPGLVYPAVMGRKGCNITSLFREGNMFSVLISCFVYPMMVI